MSTSGVVLRKAANRKNDAAATKAKKVPLGERFTAAHIWPAALAVVAAFVVVIAMQDRSRTVMVPVASKTIVSGAQIDASMLASVSLPAGSSLAGTVVPAATLNGGGWLAAVTIHQGDPITQSVVQRAATSRPGTGSMSLTVPADHANGGNLAAGDRIDVVSATAGQAQYVARGLSVISVAAGSSKSSGLSSSGPSSYYVVVAVDPPTALALTAALQTGTTGGQGLIELVRTTGEADDTNSNSVAPAFAPAVSPTSPSTTVKLRP